MQVKIDFIQVIDELNKNIEAFPKFTYTTDGWVDAILFSDTVIWDSENSIIPESQELLVDEIKREFNSWLKELNKLKFKVRKLILSEHD